MILTIEQTFTTVRLVLMTAESKSRSFVAKFIRHGTNDYTLLYIYDTTPKLEFRDRSKIHRGSTSADAAPLTCVSSNGCSRSAATSLLSTSTKGSGREPSVPDLSAYVPVQLQRAFREAQSDEYFQG